MSEHKNLTRETRNGATIEGGRAMSTTEQTPAPPAVPAGMRPYCTYCAFLDAARQPLVPRGPGEDQYHGGQEADGETLAEGTVCGPVVFLWADIVATAVPL